MPTTQIRFGGATTSPAVYAPIPDFSQSLTPSGTSQVTTISAVAGDICSITTSGQAVHAKIGQGTPIATSNDDLIPDGATRDFGPCKDGDRVAIINAT